MARGSLWIAAIREVERANRRNQRAMIAQARAVERAARERERSQKAAEREWQRTVRTQERQAKLDEKQARDAYLQSRADEVDDMNRALEEAVEALNTILNSTLAVDDYFDLDKLKIILDIPPFSPGRLAVPEPVPDPPAAAAAPDWSAFAPAPAMGISRLMPGSKAKMARLELDARRAFEGATAQYARITEEKKSAHSERLNEHATREERRLAELESKRAEYEANAAKLTKELHAQHSEIEQFKSEFERGLPKAVAEYFALVLEYSLYPDGVPHKAKVAFVPESRQLVVDFEFPTSDIVPQIRQHRFARTKDEITATARPVAECKRLYSSVLAQIALRTLHELFEADRSGKVETIVFSGHVSTIDKSTGREIRPCLLTVRATRDNFLSIDLSKVEPEACLRGLSAAVSRSPTELAAVRPIVEFNMVDSRFVEESDVLSGLDQRPNLMELTPGEFENLITNLFEKMGLETRLTQASRDGGVDCVAYDARPVFGGKVVIQAKRYKHTVGASAVRDLFGTVQNEGASKGILVTTSGYGSASYEFANNKPLELLDGSNLLYLLAEHAGIEAKIEPPDDWVDPLDDVLGSA